MKKTHALIALTIIVFFFLQTNVGCIFKQNIRSYDYSDQAPQIESISYVQVKEITTYAQGDHSDVFEYSVLKTFDSDMTETILKDLAALEYRNPSGHPYFVYENRKGVLIEFQKDSPDLVYVLYCQYGFAVISKCDRGIKVDNYGPYCDEKQWSLLMNQFDQKAN